MGQPCSSSRLLENNGCAQYRSNRSSVARHFLKHLIDHADGTTKLRRSQKCTCLFRLAPKRWIKAITSMCRATSSTLKALGPCVCKFCTKMPHSRNLRKTWWLKKLQRVGVILPVKMTGTAQHTPGLKVFGNCWVQQRVLKAARVVAIGFGRCRPTRVCMRVRACWTCGGRHR